MKWFKKKKEEIELLNVKEAIKRKNIAEKNFWKEQFKKRDARIKNEPYVRDVSTWSGWEAHVEDDFFYYLSLYNPAEDKSKFEENGFHDEFKILKNDDDYKKYNINSYCYKYRKR
jgi:hypothetical protein